MLRIGLTGGMGSGKTTVAKVFETLGIPVFYADNETKRLMNTDKVLKIRIIQNFGVDCYTNGELNRKHLASIVFNDKEKLELLNSLTHPVVIQDAIQWMNKQTTTYSIKEAALLFESGAEEMLDYVIGVYSPLPLRIKRVMNRDGISSEEVMKRINRQMNEDEKMSLCNFIITNNEQQMLIPQVIELDKKLRELANQESL
jgi:dephospho-CoA kinase